MYFFSFNFLQRVHTLLLLEGVTIHIVGIKVMNIPTDRESLKHETWKINAL